MHAEWGSVSESAARRINETRAAGGRIVAAANPSLPAEALEALGG